MGNDKAYNHCKYSVTKFEYADPDPEEEREEDFINLIIKIETNVQMNKAFNEKPHRVKFVVKIKDAKDANEPRSPEINWDLDFIFLIESEAIFYLNNDVKSEEDAKKAIETNCIPEIFDSLRETVKKVTISLGLSPIEMPPYKDIV